LVPAISLAALLMTSIGCVFPNTHGLLIAQFNPLIIHPPCPPIELIYSNPMRCKPHIALGYITPYILRFYPCIQLWMP